MKRAIAGLMFVIVSSMFFVVSAKADTDYQCLHSCMASNKGERECMGQCTYNVPGQFDAEGKTISATTSAPESHRVFSALTPVEQGQSIEKVKSKSPYTTQLDYNCMAQCLQTKMQYGSCSNTCTNVSEAKNDNPLAKASTAMTPQQSLSLQINNYNYNLRAQPHTN